jgi:hypothetical protein
MNRYKIRYIVEYIRSRGPLPRDETGSILDWDDLLAWYDLEGRLTRNEQILLIQELAEIVEAERFIEQLRLGGR